VPALKLFVALACRRPFGKYAARKKKQPAGEAVNFSAKQAIFSEKRQ